MEKICIPFQAFLDIIPYFAVAYRFYKPHQKHTLFCYLQKYTSRSFLSPFVFKFLSVFF